MKVPVSKTSANILDISQALRRAYRDDPEVTGAESLAFTIRPAPTDDPEASNWHAVSLEPPQFPAAWGRAVEAAGKRYVLERQFLGGSATAG